MKKHRQHPSLLLGILAAVGHMSFAESEVSFKSERYLWITVDGRDIFDTGSAAKNQGLSRDFWGNRFWASVWDPRSRAVVQAEVSKGGVGLVCSGHVPDLRIALLPAESDLPDLFANATKLIAEVTTAFSKLDPRYGNTGVPGALDRSLMGFLKEADLAIVESWNLRFPIPEPLELPIEGSKTAGTEGWALSGLDFFRTQRSVPSISDSYLGVTSVDYKKSRVNAWIATMKSILTLVKSRDGSHDAPPAEEIVPLYDSLFDTIVAGVRAHETEVPEEYKGWDQRLQAIKDQWFNLRKRLAAGTSGDMQDYAIEVTWAGKQETSITLRRGMQAGLHFDEATNAVKIAVDSYATSFPAPPHR